MGIGIAWFVFSALLWMGAGAALQKGEVGSGLFIMVFGFFISWLTIVALTDKSEEKTDTTKENSKQ